MNVIVDTGPLVALLHRRDKYHDWAKSQWLRLTSPLITCEAVIVEACYLSARFGASADTVMELLRRENLRLSFSLGSEAESVSRLLDKYRNVPMSLADACLVRMAELHPTMPVFTLDNDFKLYRKNGRQVIPTLSPN